MQLFNCHNDSVTQGPSHASVAEPVATVDADDDAGVDAGACSANFRGVFIYCVALCTFLEHSDVRVVHVVSQNTMTWP